MKVFYLKNNFYFGGQDVQALEEPRRTRAPVKQRLTRKDKDFLVFLIFFFLFLIFLLFPFGNRYNLYHNELRLMVLI